MKKNIILLSGLFVCLFVSSGWAAYTYEVYTHQGSKVLNGNESILIDQQGGMYGLDLLEQSTAVIKGTSTLAVGSGGIWLTSLSENSSLDIFGGQINQLDLNNNATANLYGGTIVQIWSYQWVPYTPGRDGVPAPNIKLYYSGALPTYNETTDILTGLWGNGSNFSIYLHDVAGYDPVIENIEFIPIPEPVTLLLLGLGGLLIYKK